MKLLDMVSRYALNQIVVEFERVHYADKNPSYCGCIMKTTHSLPCTCELVRYVVDTIPLDTIHMFCRRLSFTYQGLSEPKVSIIEEMKTISKQFKEFDVCGKVTIKSKLREIAYPYVNSMFALSEKVKTKGARNQWPNIKDQQSVIRLIGSMWMLKLIRSCDWVCVNCLYRKKIMLCMLASWVRGLAVKYARRNCYYSLFFFKGNFWKGWVYFSFI